jgi:hypothetical protein
MMRFVHGETDFAGIMHHLRIKCGGNPHTKGSVAITASSTESNSPVEAITDFGQRSGWYSRPLANSWVMFDFKEWNVSIEGYSINSGILGHSLASWEMEVSSDGRSWMKHDERSTNELNGVNMTRYFACNSASDEFHRYARIRQTAPNNIGYHYLEIGNLEFFGRLRRGQLTQ